MVNPASWEWPALFRVIAEGGDVSRDEMRDVFNLGVGMIAVVSPADVDAVLAAAAAAGDTAWRMGEVRAGPRAVRFAD